MPKQPQHLTRDKHANKKYDEGVNPALLETLMPPTESRHTPEELGRLGAEAFDRHVRPALRPEDDGKFVAIDIVTGDYEIDADDYTAVIRLRARRPTADVWLACVGQPTAYKLRRRQ